MKIKQPYSDSTLNLVFDILDKDKQTIIFANTRNSAEKTAEEIAKKVKKKSPIYEKMAEQALSVLSRPTKQCKRLALCLKKGIAFHHSGLTAKQKELIEDNFRNKNIKVIAATPTLCLSKDSMIWHGISETEVSKIKTSQPIFVLSRNKLICMKSQKINRLENSSKLMKISSVSSYSIKVTPNHKIYIKRKNKKQIIQAKKVRKGDKIATIGRLNMSKYSNPSLNDFIIDNKLPISNQELDLSVFYFIGAMLGDGYSGVETINEEIKYKGSPTIVGIDKEVFNNVLNICSKFNIGCTESKTHSETPQLTLGKNKWFREFLCRCGVEKREKKYISEKLMGANKEKISALLKGLFDTDGYVEKKGAIGFSNISLKLVKQIQKLLLRFGIVSRIRTKKPSKMKIYEKEYKTVEQYELTILNKKKIFDFYLYIGFDIKRKKNTLIKIIKKITKNINYVYCEKCRYKVYKDLFSGRSARHKEWGKIKLKVIRLLGGKGELASRELKQLLNQEPKKKDSRLNHHYELINKRKIGKINKSEWFWSLNKIGKWIYSNLLKENNNFDDFFKIKECPICKSNLKHYIKRGWRDSDFDGDIYWDLVREVKEADLETDVYDVVLPLFPKNEHLFVANGFIVHNSMGLDLPAYRVILKNLKRYGHRGLQYIPVLEYMQMSGRAGRPKFDNKGEAVIIANSEAQKEELEERYIHGEPEPIFSKLAVEPVLRTYVLSLIATKFVTTKKELFDFFGRTFWAHQFADTRKLHSIVEKMLKLLEEWEFIIGEDTSEDFSDFKSASDLVKKDNRYKATILGQRVAELYIDPYTAHYFVEILQKAANKKMIAFSLLQPICSTLEIRPQLKARVKDYEKIQEALLKFGDDLLEKEPSIYEPEYESFENTIKTAMFMHDWIEEKDEEFLLEEYNIRPGEIRVKLDIADWLLYCMEEITRILQFKSLMPELKKLRIRIKNGVKEELIALLKFKGIGRVRARKLYKNNIKNVKSVKESDLMKLIQILGKNTALSIKKQVGQEFTHVKENKRKGQISLKDYNE
jgi:helicase